MSKKFRVFATGDIGEALDVLRERGYEVEVYPDPEAPPKSLILEKVKSGIGGLITTLRDPIDAEVFAAGEEKLKKEGHIAGRLDNNKIAAAQPLPSPLPHPPPPPTEEARQVPLFPLG